MVGWGIQSDGQQSGVSGRLKHTRYCHNVWFQEYVGYWVSRVFRRTWSSLLASVTGKFARCRHQYFFLWMRQHHLLETECIGLYCRALNKWPTSSWMLEPFFCWHQWAKACPNHLSDQLRNGSGMNSFGLRIFGLISGHEIQYRCICDCGYFLPCESMLLT